MTDTSHKSLLQWLRADKRGTGAMELSLVLPILMLLVVGMVDISRMVAARIDTEQAAQRATDFALAIRPNGNNGTYIRNEAANAAGVPSSDVTVDIFLECNGTRQGSFTGTCSSGQDRARFVSVSIDRDVDFLFDWGALASLFGTQVLGAGATVTGDSLVRFQ